MPFNSRDIKWSVGGGAKSGFQSLEAMEAVPNLVLQFLLVSAIF